MKGGNGGFGFPRYGGAGGKGGDVSLVATEGESVSVTALTTVIYCYFLFNLIQMLFSNFRYDTNRVFG